MKITVVNGSPKKKQGTTAKIINTLETMIREELVVYQAVDLLKMSEEESDLELAQLMDTEILLFVFPLYVDCLPMPIIHTLELLEERRKEEESLPRVYAISQCGFFEGTHNHTALKIIQNFCEKNGFLWQYGIGIGAGGYLSGVKEFGAGPTKNIYDVLLTLSTDMQKPEEERENIFLSPSIPRLLYRLGGNMGWKKQGRKNGVGKELDAQPFLRKE